MPVYFCRSAQKGYAYLAKDTDKAAELTEADRQSTVLPFDAQTF